jgi:hypothetical protein
MSKRYKIERFFDKYNHLMEFIRTLSAVTVVFLQIIILVKLFKSTWLFVLIFALLGTLVLHLLPIVLKNFMDKL